MQPQTLAWHAKEWCRIYISLFTIQFPLLIDKAYGFWFCFLLFGDLVSIDSSLDFLSGHGCAAQHTQPLESLARWVYLSLCRFTPCAITSLSDAAMLRAIWRQFMVSNSLSVLSFTLLPVAYPCKYIMTLTVHTDKRTHTEFIRNQGRGLVTSWANLWLLHCHTKNENQWPWLRELAALLNSGMTLVSGLHWVLH